MSASEKGKFSADISEDVIREALEAVSHHDAGAKDGDGTAEVAGLDLEVAESPQAAEAEPDEAQLLRTQLEMSQAAGRDLMEKLRDGHERMLRAVADLDNYKKRAQKEKEELQKFAIERLLREFLPVMDNLERALEHARSSADFESLRTGLTMTRKQFEDALGRHGVKQFSAVGQAFDPHVHEAMQQVESQDVPPNHVVSELVRGYTLNDRVIRPALVLVSKPPNGAVAPSAPAESDGTQGEG